MSQEVIPWDQAPEEAGDRRQVLAMTARQINKDLNAEVVPFSAMTGLEDANYLLKCVNDFLIVVHREQPGRLAELFYRVDIPEQHVAQVFAQVRPENVVQHLSVLLIQREVQKVFSRLKYGNL